MITYLLWALVIIVTAGLAQACARLIEPTWQTASNATGAAAPGTRRRLLAAALGAVVLVAIAGLYAAHAVGKPDGALVQRLASKPGSALAQIMTYVTVLGDAVPSLLVAGILALVVYRQGVAGWPVILLPLVVVAELAVQIGIGKVFHDVTIAQLHADVPIGGVGRIPSGSVARLFSVFLTAAALWSWSDPPGAVRVVTAGVVLTTVQAVSRLVLGRHLFADILGGLALGLLLAALAVGAAHAVRGAAARRRTVGAGT